MKKDSFINLVISDVKRDYQNLFSKIPRVKNFSLKLYGFSELILAILLLMEFLKYPDLVYERIFMFIGLIISLKLSIVLYYLRNG